MAMQPKNNYGEALSPVLSLGLTEKFKHEQAYYEPCECTALDKVAKPKNWDNASVFTKAPCHATQALTLHAKLLALIVSLKL